MRTDLECIPCLVRHTLAAIRQVIDDKGVQEQVMREALKLVSEMDTEKPPPLTARRVYRLLNRHTHGRDPYAKAKERLNRFALSIYPRLKDIVEASRNPLETAIGPAIAGNGMDLGVFSQLEDRTIDAAIDRSLTRPVKGTDVSQFSQAVDSARRILFLADNAGEIVLDRLLIEQMPLNRTTYAVRGAAVINDATMTDAEACGLTDLVNVIDNGSDIPGTVPAECSEEFRRIFDAADLIISKGQGNFETLDSVDRPIFHLLTVKCPVVARSLGFEEGTLVLYRSPVPRESLQ